MKNFTTEKERNEIRNELRKGKWVSFQNVKFTFKSDDERRHFITENKLLFNSKLNELGYHGCGYAILDIDNLILVAHEQSTASFNNCKEIDLVDNIRYFKVNCSSWEIKIV